MSRSHKPMDLSLLANNSSQPTSKSPPNSPGWNAVKRRTLPPEEERKFPQPYSEGSEYPPHEENGRWYHGFRHGIYMYPCDESEQERLDIFHKLFSVAREKAGMDALHIVPLGHITSGPSEARPRILDLGCGTGIWAIDMANRFPHGYILGLDLSPMQPKTSLPNCEFQAPRDFESPWALGENSWDMIHLRMGCGSVASWPNLYRKVSQHLRPGGYFEQVEINFEPQAEGGLAPEQPLYRWYAELKTATAEAGRPIELKRNTLPLLKDAGFENVEEKVIWLPLNTWHADPDQKDVGKWYNLAFSESTTPLLLKPLTYMKGWSKEQVRLLAGDTASQAYNKECKAWNVLHIYTAQKPKCMSRIFLW